MPPPSPQTLVEAINAEYLKPKPDESKIQAWKVALRTLYAVEFEYLHIDETLKAIEKPAVHTSRRKGPGLLRRQDAYDRWDDMEPGFEL